MSKIKKCLLVIIISIMGLIVFQGESNAAYYLNDLLSGGQIGVSGNAGVGSTVYINPASDLLQRNDVYCVQYHTGLNSQYYPYYVEKYVLIEGNYGTWWGYGANPNAHIFNQVYGKVAYILEKGKSIGSGYGGSYGAYTPTQLAIYHTIGSLDTQFNASGANQNAVLTEAASQLIAEGTAYASSIEFGGDMTKGDDGYEKFKSSSSGAYINDKTDKDNVKITPYQKDGTTYIRIGPFNWEFDGNVTATSVKSDSGEISDVLYSKYVGKDEVFIDKTQITSLENFYITIKPSTEHTKIKSIDATVEKKSSGYVRAEIWLLSNTEHQNLMLARSDTVSGNPTPVTMTFDYDIKITKDLEILKIDANGKKYPLSDVAFIIRNVEMNKYVKEQDGKISYVKSKKDATEFTTDKNGKTGVEGVIIGTYEATETCNPNYGYVLEEQETTIIKVDYYDETIITNKQKYVKLSGFIWKDIHSTKQTVRNDLYKTDKHSELSEYVDDSDEAFNGITVRLMKSDGKGNAEIVKKEDGTKQEFVSKEFYEDENKKNPGKKKKDLYSEIEGGEYMFEDVLVDELSLYYIEFEYDGLEYQSVILPAAKDLGKKNVSKATDKVEREILDSKFASIDGTGNNTLNISEDISIIYNDTVDYQTSIKDTTGCEVHAKTNDAGLVISDYFKPTMEEIRYINLGLYERPQTDLALLQELERVTVGVNGYQHVYKYEGRNDDTSDSWNVGVRFVNDYTGTYKRAIYKADSEYTSNDKSNELQVKLTYEIAIKNDESLYKTTVNSIVDYFDSDYTLECVGTELDGDKNIITKTLNGYSNSEEIEQYVEQYNNDYKKINLNINTEIEAKTVKNIYLQFSLNREAVVQIMNNKKQLYNKTEITSYTVFKDDKTVAAVDKDSVPGNANINNINTFEDDTDSAPPILLELTNAREIQGTVFEDSTTVKEDGTRQGDGIYNDSVDPKEKTISGVKVTLKNEDGSVAQIYNEETKKWEDAITHTDDQGGFGFSGYVPGKYTITYTWGSADYKVQYYKGTIYVDQSRLDRIDADNNPWYKDEAPEYPRYSDALDDYEARLFIDAQTAKITDNTVGQKVEEAYKEGYTGKIVNTMDSTTPIMEFSVEYDTNATDGTDNSVKFIVKNVDFGIAERAKQQLDMEKRVKSFKITLANGNVLVDATVDEDGKLQGSHDYVTYMGPTESNGHSDNGFIKAEIDNELIEGSTLEVGYEIKVKNIGETDYMSKEYYQFGTITGDKVTLTPSAVVDYLDKDLAFDVKKNPDWEQLTIEGLQQKLGINDINSANLEVVGKYTTEDILNTRTILYTESTAVALAPGDEKVVDLNVSKLVTTSDDLTFNNDAEVVKISKPITPTPPGPTGTPVEDFPEDPSEEVEITPSTGDDRAYVVPTIVGITSMLILGVGIFVIKRTVIDNK